MFLAWLERLLATEVINFIIKFFTNLWDKYRFQAKQSEIKKDFETGMKEAGDDKIKQAAAYDKYFDASDSLRK